MLPHPYLRSASFCVRIRIEELLEQKCSRSSIGQQQRLHKKSSTNSLRAGVEAGEAKN